jgi:hypothetical protein
MKRNSIFFVAALMTLFLSVSCNRKAEVEQYSYVSMYKTEISVKEDAGELRIPVLLQNPTGAEAQVAVKIVGDTAQEGVDYELVSPANGLLFFSGDTKTAEIVLSITSFKGEFTPPDKEFTVSIESLTPGVEVGSFSSSLVTILDLDHPLAPFIGTWNGTMAGLFQQPKYETSITVKGVKGDDTYTKLTISGGLNPYFLEAAGIDDTFQATLVNGMMVVNKNAPVSYGDVILQGFDAADPNDASAYANPTFAVDEDGNLVQVNAFGAYTPGGGGFYEIYLGGTVFTREE